MTHGEILRQPTGEVLRLLRTGADTDGALFEFEATLPPRFKGPPPHQHLVEEESFEVLEGVVALRTGRRWRDLGPGESVTVPPGTIHAFANRSDQPARMLTRETPAGQLEGQLRLLAESGRLPPLLALARLNAAHDYSLMLAGVPVGLQRPLWAVLARLARQSGS